MGKLIRPLKKKDYILKTLKLPEVKGGRASLSHKELADYVRFHLPSLYPAPVEPSSLGYAVAGDTILVFILTGLNAIAEPAAKEETALQVVPFLLHPAFLKPDASYVARLVFQYEDGFDLIRFNDGSVESAEWREGRYSDTSLDTGNSQKTELIPIGSELTAFPPPLKQKPSRFEGNPFVRRRGPGTFRIVRYTAYAIAIAALLAVSAVTAYEAKAARTAQYQKEIQALSAKAVSTTEQAKTSKTLIDRYKSLKETDTYNPYPVLSGIYDAAGNARRMYGIRTYITDFRLNKNVFAIEGYTSSGLKLLQAFNQYGQNSQDGRFLEVRMSSNRRESESSTDPRINGMEGFAISGRWESGSGIPEQKDAQ